MTQPRINIKLFCDSGDGSYLEIFKILPNCVAIRMVKTKSFHATPAAMAALAEQIKTLCEPQEPPSV